MYNAMAIDLDITCYFGGLKKEIIFRAGSGKNSTQFTLPEHFLEDQSQCVIFSYPELTNLNL